jgi:uncharacterized coiled-coil protein SlyX
MQRARELEQRSAYLESQMTQQPRIIPGLNPNSSRSSQQTQVPVQTQNVTKQMAGMNIEQQV